MGLLDIEVKERFTPKGNPSRKGKADRYSHLAQDLQAKELNNLGHKKVTEDYGDSPHLDY